MQSKPFYRLGAIALIILVIYSCQKENDLTPTQPNPTTPTTPFQEPNVDVKDVPLDVGFTGPIGLKEIKGSIKGKSLVKDIIKEAFMQLLLNHDLNPMMPPAYRVACSCNPLMECACPNPELIPNSSGMTYPAKLILHYQDATTCQETD